MRTTEQFYWFSKSYFDIPTQFDSCFEREKKHPIQGYHQMSSNMLIVQSIFPESVSIFISNIFWESMGFGGGSRDCVVKQSQNIWGTNHQHLYFVGELEGLITVINLLSYIDYMSTLSRSLLHLKLHQAFKCHFVIVKYFQSPSF